MGGGPPVVGLMPMAGGARRGPNRGAAGSGGAGETGGARRGPKSNPGAAGAGGAGAGEIGEASGSVRGPCAMGLC